MYSVVQSKGVTLESVEAFASECDAHTEFETLVKQNDGIEVESWAEAKRRCRLPGAALDGLVRFAFNDEWAVYLFPDRS